MISKLCKCKNCVHVRKQQATALRATNQAATRRMAVSDDVVELWNETLKDFPCLNISPKYYYPDSVASLGDILHGFEVLCGDELGPINESWQDRAKYIAKDLRRLANMLDAAVEGRVLDGPVVFPSPSEVMGMDSDS